MEHAELHMKGVLETQQPETVAPDATADSQSRPQGGTLVYAPFIRIMTFVIIAVVVAMTIRA